MLSHVWRRPRQSWLRTVEDDLRPVNFGMATARRQALDRSAWRLLVETATSTWHAPKREREDWETRWLHVRTLSSRLLSALSLSASCSRCSSSLKPLNTVFASQLHGGRTPSACAELVPLALHDVPNSVVSVCVPLCGPWAAHSWWYKQHKQY